MAKRAKTSGGTKATSGAKSDGAGSIAQAGDMAKAIAIAALGRAIRVLEGSMDDKAVKLSEGAYPVDLTIGVNGDITVGPETTAGDTSMRPTLSDSEILAGILASRKRDVDRFALLRAGMRHASESKAEDAKLGIKELLGASAGWVLEIAKAEKLAKRGTVSTRAGAVAGKPSVSVRGTSDIRDINVMVEAAA